MPPSPRSQTIHELRPQDLAGSPRIDEARASLRVALEGRFLLVWFADVEVQLPRGDLRGRQAPLEAPDDRRAEPGDRGGRVARSTGTVPAIRSAARRGRWQVPVANPHEALDDALVTAQLFLVLAAQLPDVPSPTVRDLLRLGRA